MKVSLIKLVWLGIATVAFISLFQLVWGIWRNGGEGWPDTQILALWVALSIVSVKGMVRK